MAALCLFLAVTLQKVTLIDGWIIYLGVTEKKINKKILNLKWIVHPKLKINPFSTHHYVSGDIFFFNCFGVLQRKRI